MRINDFRCLGDHVSSHYDSKRHPDFHINFLKVANFSNAEGREMLPHFDLPCPTTDIGIHNSECFFFQIKKLDFQGCIGRCETIAG